MSNKPNQYSDLVATLKSSAPLPLEVIECVVAPFLLTSSRAPSTRKRKRPEFLHEDRSYNHLFIDTFFEGSCF